MKRATYQICVCIFGLLLLTAMIYVTAFNRMLWPLSWYPMFAGLQTQQKQAEIVSYEVKEVREDGSEGALDQSDQFFWRNVRVAILYSLLKRRQEENRCSELLDSILKAYFQYRRDYNLPSHPISRLRLYQSYGRPPDAKISLVCESHHENT